MLAAEIAPKIECAKKMVIFEGAGHNNVGHHRDYKPTLRAFFEDGVSK